jgi:acyl carrier protein
MTDDTADAYRVEAGEVAHDISIATDTGDEVKRQLIDWMKKYLADLSGIEVADIDIHSTFDRYGIDSYQGVVITHELGLWLGRQIDASDAFEHPSIHELAEFLAADPAIRAAVSGGSVEATYRAPESRYL